MQLVLSGMSEQKISFVYKRIVTLFQYFGTGNFIQATFENWESEFFQMGLFIRFTTIKTCRCSKFRNRRVNYFRIKSIYMNLTTGYPYWLINSGLPANYPRYSKLVVFQVKGTGVGMIQKPKVI